MNTQDEIDYDFTNMQDEIKALTKLLIEIYDPKGGFQDDLMAVCNIRCGAIRLLHKRWRANPYPNHQTLLNDQLENAWYQFGEVIGISALYIEAQYFQFVKK